MILRTFEFRVGKKRARAVEAFMRRQAIGLLKRLPACRSAYFLRSPRKGEYMWVTVWPSEAARRRTMSRRDWQALVREEAERFFAGRPRVTHYRVLARK